MTSRLAATLFGLFIVASSVACNVGPDADLSNDLTISGVRDPSVKPVVVAPPPGLKGGIRDPSIKPVVNARVGGSDDSIRPLAPNAHGGIADDGVKPKKP